MKDKYPQLTETALKESCELGLSLSQIRKKFNVPRGVLQFRIKKFDIKFTNKRRLVTGNEVNLIKEVYLSGLSIENTAKKLNISYDIVCDVIFQNNLGREIKDPFYRKYQIDHTYFQRIDSEEKAYFLGLLYTDGCMKEFRYCVSLGLHEQDLDTLSLYAKAIYLDHENLPIKKDKSKKFYTANIQHKGLYADLINLGLTPRKSFTVGFPTSNQVPSNLLRHFIRGVFDGDGCACLSKRGKSKKLSFVINTCSVIFAHAIRDFLFTENIQVSFRISKTSKGNNYYGLETTKQETLNKIFHLMYDNANICFQRKKSKFVEFFNSKK